MTVLAIAGRGSFGSADAPLGTDFASFYAAGEAALAGDAKAAYDPAAHFARERALFGAATPFYAWQYPPVFLLVAAPLASLPYLPALLLWQGSSFLLYLAAMLAIVRAAVPGPAHDLAGVSPPAGVPLVSTSLLLAAGYPAVFVNFGHGQNGFLTAALLGGGLVLLERRPALAGILFGLLAYKPQLAPMIPVALIAGARWRAVLGAVAAVAGLILVTLAAFGADTWRAFLASTAY